MFKAIVADYRAVFKNDPAARSMPEVLLCYAGFHALVVYRVSHLLWCTRYGKLLARMLAHLGRFITGVEIHPGALIGSGVFIDHGMGVVIGETAEVGDDVILFHGVTLGGTGKHTGKRHPRVEAESVIGAHAIILGPITIGVGARIGAGAVVLKNVPPHATVVGIPPTQRIILKNTPFRGVFYSF